MSNINEEDVVVTLVVFAISMFAISIIISIVYGVWYLDNCAFVPVSQMPGLCLVGR